MTIPENVAIETSCWHSEFRVRVDDLTKAEAEALLDELEAEHCPHELALVARQRFSVSYLCPSSN